MILSEKDRENMLKPYLDNPKKYQRKFTKRHNGNTDFKGELFKWWLFAELLIEFTSNNQDTNEFFAH